MATFRSRQRASQRRDGKREPQSPLAEEGRKPKDGSSSPRASQAGKPASPTAGKRPPQVHKDSTARAPGQANRNDRPTAAKPFAKPFSKPESTAPSFAKPRTETSAASQPASDKALFSKPKSDASSFSKPQADAAPAPSKPAPAKSLFSKPATHAPQERPAQRSEVQPQAEPRPAAISQPAQSAASTTSTTRRRLITPVSEIPEGQTPAAPVVRVAPARAEPAQADTTPVAAPPEPPLDTPPKGPRRRLITPINEVADKPAVERTAPTPVAIPEPQVDPVAATEQAEPVTPVESAATRRRREEMADRRKQYEPVQRRGLPANERMPTERPVFEQRSAEVRRRGDAPVGLAMFASCPRGLESVLQQELHRMQAEDISAVDGGVSFSGSQELLMRVNLESRVASRVLLRLAQGPYGNERDVNALAMQINWPHHFDVERTIKVKTDGVGAQVKSLDYVSLTVKDAICDRFRQAQLGRPSVDTRTPDVRIQVFLSPNSASIYLDSSGDALFKRGWRKETGEAPLRENLAAGILLLAGYNGEQPLIDPMCGSGTFLVEAAEIALNRAPGRARDFAFQKWLTFDNEAWDALKLAALQAEKPLQALPIQGSDCDASMVAIAQANLARIGLGGLVTLSTKDVFEVRPEHESGLIVTNPPYGVRMDEEDTLTALYPLLGDWLKQHFSGWTANFFSGDLRLEKLIRLKMKRRVPLYNGAIECRLFILPVVAGSARDVKP